MGMGMDTKHETRKPCFLFLVLARPRFLWFLLFPSSKGRWYYVTYIGPGAGRIGVYVERRRLAKHPGVARGGHHEDKARDLASPLPPKMFCI
jgi:hypothetical protein